MEYTVEQVDQVGERLLALPAIEPSKRKLDKQAAVRRLTDAIATLQQRGYTLEQIAQSMSGLGIQITTPTLKSYLQRARKPSSRGAARTPRRAAAAKAPRQPIKDAKQSTASVAPLTAGKPDSAPKSTHSEFIATDRERL
jgi:hypothetical protein